MGDGCSSTHDSGRIYDLPETNLPRQLINGEVYEITAPELDHQDVVGNVFLLFKQASKALRGKAYIAPVDVEFDADNVPQPDVILLLPGSRCQPAGNKRLMGPSDLIAKVLSPSTARLDRREKSVCTSGMVCGNIGWSNHETSWSVSGSYRKGSSFCLTCTE